MTHAMEPCPAAGPEAATGGATAAVRWTAGITASAAAVALLSSAGASFRPTLAGTLVLGVLLHAAWTDLLRGVILNRLTYPTCGVGLALAAAQHAAPPALAGLMGFPEAGGVIVAVLLVGAVGLAGLLMGAWGGGDAKLALALAPFLGLQDTVRLVFAGLVAVAALYSLHQLTGRVLLPRIQDAMACLARTLTGRSPVVVRVQGRVMPLGPGFLIAYPALHLLAPTLTEVLP